MIDKCQLMTFSFASHMWLTTFLSTLLVSVGHLCDLQGLFSEIDNLHTVNPIELQLMLA